MRLDFRARTLGQWVCAVWEVVRCDGVRLLNDECEVRGSGRILLDALRLKCFVSAVLLGLAGCSTDNAARVVYCPASFFCDKGCKDSDDGGDGSE